MKDSEVKFEHRLARDLGMTVAHLRLVMANSEFVNWAAFYNREADEQKRELDKVKAQSKARPKKRR